MPSLRLALDALPLPKALRGVPRPALYLIALLVLVNLAAWAAAGIVLRFFPALTGPAVLSYTLGLRHALDADHISAIDLMTRRLVAAGQRPAAVGTFFSLGHSTIVIVTCVVVAATSGALRDRFDGFQRVGNIVGTSVSAAFLLILCAGNGWVLWRLVRVLRAELALQREREQRRRRASSVVIAAAPSATAAGEIETGTCGTANEDGCCDDNGVTVIAEREVAEEREEDPTAGLKLEGTGFLATVFRRLFRMVDRPWKMFPLGIMFGLGFDTSSEIALLGIASIQGAQGTSMWLILIFPVLFTVGMCLLDTTDGALMMALYTSKAFARDTVAILYYSAVLTGITILVSAFIGVIQLLSLVQNVADPQGPFWDGVGAIGDNFDIVGGCICGLFVLVGLGSILLYRPWRRRMERRGEVLGGEEAGVVVAREPELGPESP